MLNFCVFTFISYALFAIVKMLLKGDLRKNRK